MVLKEVYNPHTESEFDRYKVCNPSSPSYPLKSSKNPQQHLDPKSRFLKINPKNQPLPFPPRPPPHPGRTCPFNLRPPNLLGRESPLRIRLVRPLWFRPPRWGWARSEV